VLTPGRQGGHVLQRGRLHLFPGLLRVPARLPAHHPLETLVERLQVAVGVDAVTAYRPVSIGIPQLSQVVVVVIGSLSLGGGRNQRGGAGEQGVPVGGRHPGQRGGQGVETDHLAVPVQRPTARPG
jgi:hypothetical protein